MKPILLYFSKLVFVVALLLYISIPSVYSQKKKKVDITANHPQSLKVEALSQLNSRYRETSAHISADGKQIFFVSLRGKQPWTSQAQMVYGMLQYDADIYVSDRNGNKWNAPLNIGNVINQASGEDEPTATPDGQHLLFQSWRWDWLTTGGPYYVSDLKGSTWQSSQGLGGGVSAFFKAERVANPKMATDGSACDINQTVFLVAYAPRVEEAMDIYMSTRKRGGEWSNLSRIDINTVKNDRTVFITPDGKTIYFASDGYGGFGGLDIFKTTLNSDGTFGQIINLGQPFNSIKDDYGFSISASGNEIVFLRNSDIYYADATEADPAIKPATTKLIFGTVKYEDDTPIESALTLTEAANQNFLTSASANSLSGKYVMVSTLTQGKARVSVTLPNAKIIDKEIELLNKAQYEEIEVNFVLKKDGTLVADSEITLSKSNATNDTISLIIADHSNKIDNIISKKIEEKLNIVPDNPDNQNNKPVDVLKPDTISQVKILPVKNPAKSLKIIVVFNYNEAIVNQLSGDLIMKELNGIDLNNIKRVEVLGFTDNTGDNSYNLALGKRRANGVVEFIVKQGIAKSKISKIESMGESNPTENNATPEGRNKNRRVELLIEL